MTDDAPRIGHERPGRSAAEHDEYDAALASLLAYAGRSPGALTRLRSTLVRLHELHNADLARLPIEYWYWLP